LNGALVLAQLLSAANVGTYTGTTSGGTIFLAKEPETPDKCITLYNSAGFTPNPKWAVDFPSVQVRVRGSKNAYVASRAFAQSAKDALLGVTSQAVTGGRLVSVTMMGDLMDLPFDQSNRPLHVINFNLIVEPTATGNRTAL
jgi:hypothetical protein